MRNVRCKPERQLDHRAILLGVRPDIEDEGFIGERLRRNPAVSNQDRDECADALQVLEIYQRLP
jgi:hypothetical protein